MSGRERAKELWAMLRGQIYFPPPRPCPPEITSGIGRKLWDLIETHPVDIAAIKRVLAEWSTRNYGADTAVLSGAVCELDFYKEQP